MAAAQAVTLYTLDLLEEAQGPRTTREAGFRWTGGEDWKRLVFTAEQPWQDEATHAQWMARKEEYRELRAAGKV